MSKETYTNTQLTTYSDRKIADIRFSDPRELVELTGIEPATPCLQSRCSPN